MSGNATGLATSLKVSRQSHGRPEIFYSLQGEGVTIGTPSVFLRLALCNLSCTWCDTKYTWDWQHFDYQKEVIELTPDHVADELVKYGCPRVVITGGEPLLQQDGLATLVGSLKERGFYFEVETNGTIVPIPHLARQIDQWNVSPKLRSSGNLPQRRECAPALEFFSRLANAYFKFVVVEQGDIDEVLSLVRNYQLPRDRVILMPEGRSKGVLLKRGRWVSEECIKEGFRFSQRLHILLWGDKRGS